MGLALIGAISRGRRDLKPDREQLPNTQDHQERDKAYRQRLPYFGGFRLNRGSDHLPTLV